jgi:A/G-specific adenine glycosylase
MPHLIKRKDIHHLQVRLIQWYRSHQRDLPWRHTHHPYPIWVSEVMLQQTQVNTVIPYYKKFMASFPDIEALASANQETVLKKWEGLGYYARARNLHRAAQQVQQRYQGEIPTKRHEFKKLPGVGDYISAAVLSIAFGQPYGVVDGNVKRVLARLCMVPEPVNDTSAYKVFQALADRLLDEKQPGTYNQALMELGALVCKPAGPRCAQCPLPEHCLAFQKQATAAYPKRRQRKAVPLYRVAAGVVFRQDRVLITRRREEGLLGGLWEFPGGKVLPGERPEDACVREIKEETNLAVRVTNFLKRVQHGYTHFKIKMDVFCCAYKAGEVRLQGPIDYRWIKLTEISDYPFPRANHKFIPHLLENNCAYR